MREPAQAREADSEPDGDPSSVRALFRRSLSSESAARMARRERQVISEARPAQEAARMGKPELAGTDGVVVKAQLQERLLEEISRKNLLGSGEEAIAQAVQDFVARVLADEDLPLNGDERARLADELTEEALGLGPLAALMVDPAVTDILVNGPDQVYVERFGRLEKTQVRFRDREHILRIIERLAMRIGRRIDAAWPMVDLRLADGSRVNATIPPASIDGPTLSIRRFGKRRLRQEDLMRAGMFSPEMGGFLAAAVRGRLNILVSGGTGAGKSTLLGALAESIASDERIVTIEDTAELLLDQDHVVRLETRPPNVEGRGQITQRDLLINALRMRPTRILVGEVRAGEALDMLQAMNTGHDGGLCTLHANSPRDALSRLETMVLMAGMDLPSRAIREQIVAALDLVVHVRRFEDGVRRVESISEVVGLEGLTPLMQDLFRFERSGRQGRRILGSFAATGIVPRFAEEMRTEGQPFSMEWFQRVEGSGGRG